MRASTMRDLAAMVRSARRSHGLTQADLAAKLGVSRDWVVRLEQASPRLEVHKVLDALAALGLRVEVSASGAEAQGVEVRGEPDDNPFDFLTPTT